MEDLETRAKKCSEPLSFVYKIAEKLVGEMGGKGYQFYLSCVLHISLIISQLVKVCYYPNIAQNPENPMFLINDCVIFQQLLTYRMKGHLLRQYQELSIETYRFILKNEKLFCPSFDFEKTIFQKNNKMLWKFYKVWIVTTLTSLIVSVIAPFLSNDAYNCFFKFPFSIWMPLGCEYIMVNFIIYLYALMGVMVVILIFVSAPMLRYNIASTVGCQCRALQYFLEELGKDTSESENIDSKRIIADQQCRVCINLHQLIEKQIIVIDDIYTTQLVIEFLSFTLVMCICGYTFITVRQSHSELLHVLGFFVIASFYFYIVCSMGSSLHEKVTGIAHSCYQSDWYNLTPENRKAVSLIISRSQESRHIRALKRFDASLKTFDQLVRMSYSFFLFLLNAQKASTKKGLI